MYFASGSEGLGFESQRSHIVPKARNPINKGFFAFFANIGRNIKCDTSRDLSLQVRIIN